MRFLKLLSKHLKHTLSNEKGFIDILLAAIGKAILKNMQKASKGEKQDATISITDLFGGGEGGEGEIKGGEGGKGERITEQGIKNLPVEQKDNFLKNLWKTGKQLMGVSDQYPFSETAKTPPYPEGVDTMQNQQEVARRGMPINIPRQEIPIQQPTMTPTIPERYRNLVSTPTGAQATQQDPSKRGFASGFFRELLGMPRPEEKELSPWYYAGALVPEIARARAGVSTSGEVARGQKAIPISLQNTLARYKLLLPNMTEEERLKAYYELATEFPDNSIELKRIFLPSQAMEFPWG